MVLFKVHMNWLLSRCVTAFIWNAKIFDVLSHVLETEITSTCSDTKVKNQVLVLICICRIFFNFLPHGILDFELSEIAFLNAYDNNIHHYYFDVAELIVIITSAMLFFKLINNECGRILKDISKLSESRNVQNQCFIWYLFVHII